MSSGGKYHGKNKVEKDEEVWDMEEKEFVISEKVIFE